jgi:hypothetical protein
MSSPEQRLDGPGGSGGHTLGRVLALIGAGGALIGWVALVGAIREYARFAAAGIPSPAQTAGLFPREALIGEGLTALVPPLLIGLGLAALTFVSCSALTTWVTRRSEKEEKEHELEYREDLARLSEEELDDTLSGAERAEREEVRLRVLPGEREERRSERRRVSERYLRRGVLAVAIGFFLVGVLLLWAYYVFVWQELVLALGLLAGLVAAVEFSGWFRSASVAAISVFAAIAIYGGVGEFWHQGDEPNPRFDSVVVYRRQLATVSGFFLTRSGGDIYVAVLPQRSAGRSKFAILSIPDGQTELVVLGPEYRLTKGEVELQGGQGQPGVSRTPAPRLHGQPTPEPQVEPVPTVPTPPAPQPTPVGTTSTQATGTTGTSTPQTTGTANTTPSSTSTQTKPPRGGAAIRVFALDELVPGRHNFCLPIGSGPSREKIALEFSAHVRGANPETVFLAEPSGFELAPESKRWVHVAISPKASELLRRGRTVAVDVAIAATAPGGESKSLTYRLDLLEPGGQPGRPPCGL